MQQILLWVIAAYAGVGLAVGLAFVSVGVSRVDEAMGGTHWSVRILLLPGAVAVWPIVLMRWFGARGAKGEPR
ncbi:MAG: hypothetical protein ACF8SC_10510 [Phycisphaerales bacterium JB037]